MNEAGRGGGGACNGNGRVGRDAESTEFCCVDQTMNFNFTFSQLCDDSSPSLLSGAAAASY